MSIVIKRHTPRTNWITAALLVILVTGFGVFADAHVRTGATATAELETVTSDARTIVAAILNHS